MKFCPYCGVPLAGSAASFCAECGEALHQDAKPHNSAPEEGVDPIDQEIKLNPSIHNDIASSSGYRKLAKLVMRPSYDKAPGKKRKPRSKKTAELSRNPGPELDEGYDGYYNDVTPLDNGHIHERMDPELIKRIIYITAGAAAVIILSIFTIYLL